jgi:ATP-dependent RNA helicase DDX24/MAK5
MTIDPLGRRKAPKSKKVGKTPKDKEKTKEDIQKE